MTDRSRSFQQAKVILVENRRDQPHAAVGEKPFTVGADDASTLLAPVLELIESIKGQLGSLRMTEDAEDTTVMLRIGMHVTTGLRGGTSMDGSGKF